MKATTTKTQTKKPVLKLTIKALEPKVAPHDSDALAGKLGSVFDV